jgi:hypothetical protein
MPYGWPARTLLAAVAVLSVASACGGAGSEPPTATVPPAPPPTAASTAAPATSPAILESTSFDVTPEGELETPGEITFRVRPLSGPGTMGPRELAPESDAALGHVQKYLEAHPDQRLRVECSVNVLKTSSGPNAGYAANLASLVARWLVDHGAACKHVEPVGRLERAQDAPVEKIRFLVRWGPAAPDAREDACSPR